MDRRRKTAEPRPTLVIENYQGVKDLESVPFAPTGPSDASPPWCLLHQAKAEENRGSRGLYRLAGPASARPMGGSWVITGCCHAKSKIHPLFELPLMCGVSPGTIDDCFGNG